MKYLYSLTIVTFFTFLSCSPQNRVVSDRTSSNKSQPLSSARPGSCNTKVMVPTTYTEEPLTVIRYTGANISQEGIIKRERVIVEASTDWVKKKSSQPCRSSDPNDCLVWCLVDIPEEKIIEYFVQDTNLIKDFKVEIISKKSILSHAHTEWAETLCDSKLSKSFKLRLSSRLKELGYLSNPTNKFNKEVKQALKAYQNDNELSYGALTIETLDHLGVNY